MVLRIVNVTQQQAEIAAAQRAYMAAKAAAPKPIPRKSDFITWQDVRSWKDPKATYMNKGPAFKMIREILSESPKTTQEIVDLGLEYYMRDLARSKPDSPEYAAAKASVEYARQPPRSDRSKKRDTVVTSLRDFGQKKEEIKIPRIPKGHPFVSVQ